MGQVISNTTPLTGQGIGAIVSLDLKMRNPNWVKVFNSSPFFITVDTGDTSQYSLGPGEEDLYPLSAATGTISVSLNASLSLQNPPSNQIVTTAFSQVDQPSGSYPLFSNVFVGIGNTVTTVGLTNYFDVKNPLYGAVGNGVVDDTAAIQAAISAAQAAGGGVVYFPVGIYLVHLTQNPNVAGIYAAMHVPSHIMLMGDGSRSSEIRLAAGAAIDQQSIITNYFPGPAGTDTQIHMRDLGVNGQASLQTPGVTLSACDGIKFRYVRDILIESCISKNNIGTTGGPNGPSGLTGESHAILIYNSLDVVMLASETYAEAGNNASSGFACSGCFNVAIEACSSHDLTYGAGFTNFQTNHLRLSDCQAYSLVSNSLLLEQCNYCAAENFQGGGVTPVVAVDSIAANTNYAVARGISCQSSKHCQFTNCLAINATSDGFETKIAASDPGVACSDILYCNCLAFQGSANGWNIQDTTADVYWSNCAARSNAGIGFWIQSTDTTGRFLFTNCQSENNNFGYEFDASPAVGTARIANSDALNSTTAALRVAGTNYSRLDGALGNPAVPGSTTPLTNPFPFPMTVTITGGTVTVIALDGTTTGLTSGTVRVPVGKSITLTYTVAPSWVWIAD